MKAAWDDDKLWAPCVDHTIELTTLPFTYVQKHANGKDSAIPKGSVAESFAKGRGIVGYLHHSTIGLSDFHACQKRVGLEEETIDQDVKTRWRTAHNMGDQLVYNKSAVLEMDKDPKYKEAGETWGKNKLSFVDWDHLEESSACLMEAAVGSQLLEGDEYPTSSLVIPTVFRLMAYSAQSHDIYFCNRDEDEFNDPVANPVTVGHTDLQSKVQDARNLYHNRLITRFDTELPHHVKKFWYVSSMLQEAHLRRRQDAEASHASRCCQVADRGVQCQVQGQGPSLRRHRRPAACGCRHTGAGPPEAAQGVGSDLLHSACRRCRRHRSPAAGRRRGCSAHR